MGSHLVLVVDDEPLIRLLVADVLREAMFDVLEAGDATSALEVLRTIAGIQLLCTDVQMPGGVDGVDLALRVKALHPKVQIILMSGFTTRDVRLAGCPFLSKPFAPARLVEVATRQLRLPPERKGREAISRFTRRSASATSR